LPTGSTVTPSSTSTIWISVPGSAGPDEPGFNVLPSRT